MNEKMQWWRGNLWMGNVEGGEQQNPHSTVPETKVPSNSQGLEWWYKGPKKGIENQRKWNSATLRIPCAQGGSITEVNIYMGGNFWNLLVEIEVYLLSVIPGLLWEGVFCMIYGNHHQSTLYCRDGRMKSETKVSSWSRVWPLALALITCPSLWYCLQKERQSLKVSKYHIDFQI